MFNECSIVFIGCSNLFNERSIVFIERSFLFIEFSILLIYNLVWIYQLLSLRKLFYFVQWTYSLENWTLNAQKKDCSLNVQTCSFVFKKKICVEPNDKNLFIDQMTINNFERSLNNRWTTFEQWMEKIFWSFLKNKKKENCSMNVHCHLVDEQFWFMSKSFNKSIFFFGL